MRQMDVPLLQAAQTQRLPAVDGQAQVAQVKCAHTSALPASQLRCIDGHASQACAAGNFYRYETGAEVVRPHAVEDIGRIHDLGRGQSFGRQGRVSPEHINGFVLQHAAGLRGAQNHVAQVHTFWATGTRPSLGKAAGA